MFKQVGIKLIFFSVFINVLVVKSEKCDDLLTFVAEARTSKQKHIDYPEENVLSLCSNTFDNLPSLENLEIKFTNLQTIYPYFVSNVPNLTVIQIIYNSLEHIMKGTFENLNVIHINLSHNKIREIEPGSFNYVPKLEGIYLEDNQLTKLKTGILNFPQLKKLSIKNNKLQVIESNALDDMHNLIQLNLEENQLSEYDPEWFKNAWKLESIVLTSNAITKIPPNSFKNLKDNSDVTVRLASNKITTISPDAFIDAPKLHTLDLNRNTISEIPENLFDFGVKPMPHLMIFANQNLTCLSKETFKMLFQKYEYPPPILFQNPWNINCKKKFYEYAKIFGCDDRLVDLAFGNNK